MKLIRLGRSLSFWTILLLISGIGLIVFAAYNWPLITLPVEVKEPIEIIEYAPSELILFPGETKNITISVQNHASANYSVVLDFHLSDTVYQNYYVKFSDDIYTVIPGHQVLTAWLMVESHAPSITVSLTIELQRVRPQVSPPEMNVYPIDGDNNFYPEAKLLGLDIDPEPGNQSETWVLPSQSVEVTITFRIWEPRGPAIINQLFIIYSWSPTWPPPLGYYLPLYNGQPGYEGVTLTENFTLTAPDNSGEYFLWFCAAEQLNMNNAIKTFTELPTLPAHARIVVENP